MKRHIPPSMPYTSPIDFLMVAGDGRDDECIFRWANDLSKDKAVKNVTTVSLGNRNTGPAQPSRKVLQASYKPIYLTFILKKKTNKL